MSKYRCTLDRGVMMLLSRERLTKDKRVDVALPHSRILSDNMLVKVLYFGVLKDLVGGEREEVELPEGSAAESLVQRMKKCGLADAGMMKSIAIAVNREYVRSSAVLHDGDEVALLPPVSGGSNHAG